MARKKQRLRRQLFYNSLKEEKEIIHKPLTMTDNSVRIEEIEKVIPVVQEDEVALQESPFEEEQSKPELVVEELKVDKKPTRKVKKTSITKPKTKAKPKITAKAKPKAKRKPKAPAKR